MEISNSIIHGNANVKKLYPDSIVPSRGSASAAGYDLYAHIGNITDSDRDRAVTIQPGETVMISSGVAMNLPKGTFGGVFARSGLSLKKGLRPGNCVGVIDSDYTGEIMVGLYNDSKDLRVVKNGDRIAQLVIIPYATVDFKEVDSLEETDRGEGGFGSTGV